MPFFHIFFPAISKLPWLPWPPWKNYLKKNTPTTKEPQSANWYQNTPKYMVSLLKAWYGDKATKENDFGYANVPKLDDGQDCTLLNMIDKMYEGKVKGVHLHRPGSGRAVFPMPTRCGKPSPSWTGWST